MQQSEKNRPFIKRGAGSLAFRILIIEVALLVVPLLLFAVLMYFEDSRLKGKDNFFTLDLIQQGKRELIQEFIESEANFLSDLSLLHPDQSALVQLANQEIPSVLFHLNQREGEYICDQSSDPMLVGKNLTPLVPKDLSLSGVLIGASNDDHFYFFKPFANGSEVWGSYFSEKRLTNKLPIAKDIPYSMVISLLSPSGIILLSTNLSWQGQQFPIALGKKTVSFRKEQYISVAENISASNLLILVTAPKSANFVDIPYFFLKMTILLLIILTFGGGMTIWLIFRLGRPLKKFCLVMRQVSLGNLSARYYADRMGFEINVIGATFNRMIESLVELIDRIKYEQAAKETFEKELMIGQEVQASILPKKLPSFPGLDIAARFMSAREVGGDFYDFVVQKDLDKERLFFAVADTAGKGIYACLYSLSLRSMLRSYVEIHSDLDVIVRETNHLFSLDTGDSGVFVTAWLAFFDKKTQQLHYSNCGHFPALLMRRDETVEKLTTAGMALGVEPFDRVDVRKTSLEKGDSLLLFTDGVVEAHNAQMEMFGERRLIEAFKKRQSLCSKEIVDEIIEEVLLFSEDVPQYDDLTLLVLKT